MEEMLIQYEKVAINAGGRGSMLMMDPKDIRDALNAVTAKISGTWDAM